MIRRHLPHSLRARLLVAVALIAAPAGSALAVTAHAAGGDSSAVAVNTKDGSSVFKLTFQIRQVMGDTVDNQNAAVAYSSCDACQTVAISIQIILAGGDASTFTPGNYAIAINENCTLCDTLASAYQFAVGVGTKLKFTAGGRRQIADIRRQLEQLRNSGLSGPEIQSRVSDLMTQLSGVLSTQLVGVSEPANPDAGAGQPPDSGAATGTGTDTTPQQPQPPTSTTPQTSTTPTTTDTTPQGTGTTTSTTPDQGTGTGTTQSSP